MTRFTRAIALALAALVPLVAAAAHAQGAALTDARRAPSIVRVHVADSLGAAVPDAEVSLMRGLKQVVVTGRTNASGDHDFLVDLDSTDYSVVARKVGYARGDRFVAVDKAAVNARVVIRELRGTLPSVTVTAVDLKRKSYHLDADDIATSPTYVRDALDIVRFLRPDMIVSRSGSASGRSAACPPLSNVWVNGRRYSAGFIIVDPIARTRAKGMGFGLNRVHPGNVTILAEIAPEHISEMNYRDCFENNMKMVGSNDALFITLKPGVDYRLGYGTYVVGDTVATAKVRDR